MNDQLHLDTIAALPAGQQVVMLNLMKFRAESLDGDGSGWDAYVRYSKLANGHIKERGGRIFWAGEANGASFGPAEHGDWDYTALVSYPTPAAFLDMMQNADYINATVHRDNGCEAHLIIAVTETFNGLANQ